MLPEPGTSHFLPRLLLHVDEILEETSGTTWSFDNVLFSTLLLARIANRGGVIIDVATGREGRSSRGRDASGDGGGGGGRKARKEEMARVVACVRAICESIFGLATTQSHVSSTTTARGLPYTLLRNAPPPPAERERGRKSRPQRPQRTRETSAVSIPTATATGASSRYATALPSPASGIAAESSTPGFFVPGGTGTGSTATTPAVTPRVTPKPSMFLQPPGASNQTPSSTTDTWLPSPPADDRPPPPSVPDIAILSGLENADSPVWIKLVEILTTRRIRLSSRGKRSPRAVPPINGEVDVEGEALALAPEGPAIQDEVEQVWEKEGLECGELMVVWVRDEEEAEACPGWLIDYFACSAIILPDSLDLPPPELLHQAIIPPDYIHSLTSLLAYTHIHPTLQLHLSNLVSAIAGHPRLSSTLTGRAVTSLPLFTTAHRLLSDPFDLPPGWESVLSGAAAADADEKASGKWGLGGGPGGVDTWAARAGEEPTIRDLAVRAQRHIASTTKRTRSPLAERSDGGEYEGEDWYCTPKNAAAAFELCVRHRVRAREERGEVMWLLKGNASGLVRPGGDSGAAQDGKEEKDARRRRDEVDRILAEIQRVV